MSRIRIQSDRQKKAMVKVREEMAKARAEAKPLPRPTLGRAEPKSLNAELPPVHIVVAMGGSTRITKCGKAMTWSSWTRDTPEESEECRRCGTHAEFLSIAEENRQRREQERQARKQKEAQEKVEREKAYEEEGEALNLLALTITGYISPCQKGRVHWRQASSFTSTGARTLSVKAN